MQIKNFLNSILRNASERNSGNASFSQEAEDLVLAELFENKNTELGFYVDVGAHHPTRFSNTWKFYLMGWRGINIDPTPGNMNAFHKLRPGDVNLEVGVSLYEGGRQFFCYNEPALNGIDNDRQKELEKTNYKLERIIAIKTLPLAEILNSNCKNFFSPNFLNIDVEGLEMEVLSSNDWDRYRFDVILVEQRLESIDLIASSEIYNYLSLKGYKPVACTGRTVIYNLQKGKTI
jgi:hypothetical protein